METLVGYITSGDIFSYSSRDGYIFGHSEFDDIEPLMSRMSDVVIVCHIRRLELGEIHECEIERDGRSAESPTEHIDTREYISRYQCTLRSESTPIEI